MSLIRRSISITPPRSSGSGEEGGFASFANYFDLTRSSGTFTAGEQSTFSRADGEPSLAYQLGFSMDPGIRQLSSGRETRSNSKVYSANDVNTLGHYLDALEAREGIERGTTKILCVATETAASLLTFHTYLEGVTKRLTALTWGGEDLSAALGASDNRHPVSGDYDDPYLLARSFALAASRATFSRSAPPSSTATHELVVPRSIPMILAIFYISLPLKFI